LLIATYGKIDRQSTCTALAQVMRAASGKAVTTPTIQGV
jgi:hypothetical protein